MQYERVSAKSLKILLSFKNGMKHVAQKRTIMPIIDETKTVDDVIASIKDFDVVLFANERTDKGEKIKDLSKYKNIGIIVGSEGGFSQKEKEAFIKAGAVSISLGRRIYRCETASVAMMSLVSILSGN